MKMLVDQSCPTLWYHGLQLARSLCPWNSPEKNTRVGSHSLLQGPRDQKPVSCIAGRFFTVLATPQIPCNYFTLLSLYCGHYGMRFSVQFISVPQSCLTLWHHGLQHATFPVHLQVLEPPLTHIHRVGDALKPWLVILIIFFCLVIDCENW